MIINFSSPIAESLQQQKKEQIDELQQKTLYLTMADSNHYFFTIVDQTKNNTNQTAQKITQRRTVSNFNYQQRQIQIIFYQ